jgi:flagellar biosynthetic protein FliO
MALPVFQIILAAQVEPGNEVPKFDSGANLLWMLVQTFLVLAFVCALAWVILRVLSRHSNRFAQNSMMQIVDRIPLDQRRSIFIVKVAGRWLVIGSSEGGVELITELDPEAAEREAEESTRARSRFTQAPGVFTERILEAIKRRK